MSFLHRHKSHIYSPNSLTTKRLNHNTRSVSVWLLVLDCSLLIACRLFRYIHCQNGMMEMNILCQITLSSNVLIYLFLPQFSYTIELVVTVQIFTYWTKLVLHSLYWQISLQSLWMIQLGILWLLFFEIFCKVTL